MLKYSILYSEIRGFFFDKWKNILIGGLMHLISLRSLRVQFILVSSSVFSSHWFHYFCTIVCAIICRRNIFLNKHICTCSMQPLLCIHALTTCFCFSVISYTRFIRLVIVDLSDSIYKNIVDSVALHVHVYVDSYVVTM